MMFVIYAIKTPPQLGEGGRVVDARIVSLELWSGVVLPHQTGSGVILPLALEAELSSP